MIGQSIIGAPLVICKSHVSVITCHLFRLEVFAVLGLHEMMKIMVNILNIYYDKKYSFNFLILHFLEYNGK